MLWISLCLITAIVYSFSGFLDNYITDVAFAKRKPQAMKVFNGITYLLIASMILIFKPDLAFPDIKTSILIFISGAITALSSIPYYIGLKKEEATGAAILEQMGPVLFLLANVFIFRERLEVPQILALILLMSAPLIIVLSHKRRRQRKNQAKTTALFALYVLLVTISSIIFAKVGEGQDYFSCFLLFMFGRGAFDVTASLLRKDWRKDFSFVWRKRRKIYLKAAITNQILCIIAEFTSRMALIEGNTAIASALMNSSKLIFTFILGIVLTMIWPKFGREKLEKRLIMAHLVGVVACVIGVVIIDLSGL